MNSTLALSSALGLLLLTGTGRADPLDHWVVRHQSASVSNFGSAFVYNGEEFVAVGESGVILSSADGMTWMQSQSGMTNSLSGIAYGNGQFVAVGESAFGQLPKEG